MRHRKLSVVTVYRTLFLSQLALVFIVITGSSAAAQTTPEHDSNTARTNSKDWALVIHGGAGGDPTNWSEAQKSARLKGVEAALEKGRAILAGGGTALDAVEQSIRLLEDNPAFNAGRGAVLTSEKRAELDASIMDGASKACGAVASITEVRNPISVARLVMTETRHVLLIGTGADQFAARQQVERVSPDYFRLKPDEADQSLYLTRDGSYLGTVGCVALDQQGNLAAGTSTGGLAEKLPGRVGDSPIIGAGNYADNATCAVSATGVGEEYIRNAIAYDVAAQMKYLKVDLENAVDTAIHKTLRPDTGGLIAVDSDGTIAMAHNTPGMTYGASDSSGRFEVQLSVRKNH